MMKELLKVNQLSVGYNSGSAPLHSNINVEVLEGEFICLLGPNGAGKSTLIKTLSGFLQPIHGTVLYGEQDLNTLPESQISKMVSVVLTDRIQIQNLTVFELVALGRTPYTGFFGKLTPDDVQLVHKAIDEVGLKGYTYKTIDKMSDGERQKAMIAKALVQETPFIILDEPTAFLDLPAKLEIMQLLKRLSCEKKRGILLSTHDLEMALQIADKIWLLAQGKELKVGIPEDLILSNDFKTFFEREGVVFDNNSGSFKYHRINSKPVALEGDSVASKWVGRALYRLGYNPVSDSCEYKINVVSNGDNLYSFYENDKLMIECNKIQTLMEKVVETY
ncbi:ABC transporter ATP-binding protein [Plebeiibacterium sediminum]|uniref:ABC transporter ATP-binding protein n=1 Tax=Plebeiibacterium sediminum TaxID=2992112 RepID=A0AAE3M5K0_9BACT|nr:ABC transporter ATP-binding protein [Plebeiobacterium sediminum]MCW3787356.1 ABC transporter ATP-binding protein [Plebeiobacterium sediminum]